MKNKSKTFLGQVMLIVMGMTLAGCSTSPFSSLGQIGNLSQLASSGNTSSPAQLSKLTIPTRSIVSAVSNSAQSAMGMVKKPRPGTAEYRHRQELIARGEIEEKSLQPLKNVKSIQTTIDNCQIQKQASSQMPAKTVPKGISECELVTIKGKPKEVRRLSMPNEPRRILLSYAETDGQTSIFEFVKNKLTTIY